MWVCIAFKPSWVSIRLGEFDSLNSSGYVQHLDEEVCSESSGDQMYPIVYGIWMSCSNWINYWK